MQVQFHDPNWRWKVSTQSACPLCSQLVLSGDSELVGETESISMFLSRRPLSFFGFGSCSFQKSHRHKESFNQGSKEWRIKHMPSYLHPHGVTFQLRCLEKYWYPSQSHKMETFRMLKLDNCACSEISYFIGQNDFWLRIVLNTQIKLLCVENG